jgi:hypothetical protein
MQHRGSRRRLQEQRAPKWAALGAVFALLLAGLIAIPGCLNPRPEEDPSAANVEPADDSDVASPAASGPIRETCGDDPLLAGCQPPAPSPSPGSVDEPASPSEEEPPAAPADAGAPDLNDAGGVDAGAAASAGSALAD